MRLILPYMLGNISVAVGETADSSPFELAVPLSIYGFDVPYIFADHGADYDQEHMIGLPEIDRI